MLIRRFLAFFLLVTLSVSSIAMPVFTHVCNGMGKTWISIFVPPNDCCGKTGTDAKTCESTFDTSEDCTLSKLPCCENEVSFATLGAGYTTQSPASLSLLQIAGIQITSIHPNLIGYEYNTNIQTSGLNVAPSPRYGRSLLIFEQLFLC